MAEIGAAELLDEASLPGYLRARGLAGDEPLSVEPAGDGNINWVRRVRAPRGGRSWIVKQARPALERFPEYRASTERILAEQRFFAVAGPLDPQGVCPRVLSFDARRRVLVLEDLGAVERLDAALARGAREPVAAAARRIGAFLGALHRATAPRAAELAGELRNEEMRRLHGDHIFVLPFRPNDFPLEGPLRARAERLWADAELVDVADRAHARYREPRGALLHGDVQPANVLLAQGGAKLLDAEIAQVSDPAFDVGMLLGHLVLPAAAGAGAVADGRAAADALWSAYRCEHGDGAPPLADVARYAGIEILRRTVGAARVDLVRPTAAALAAVDAGARLARRPPGSLDALATALDSR